jgi:hypothetical protein
MTQAFSRSRLSMNSTCKLVDYLTEYDPQKVFVCFPELDNSITRLMEALHVR